jgi:hypothetical protein
MVLFKPLIIKLVLVFFFFLFFIFHYCELFIHHQAKGSEFLKHVLVYYSENLVILKSHYIIRTWHWQYEDVLETW